MAYMDGFEELVDVLTKDEMKMFLKLIKSKYIKFGNIIDCKFSDITKEMKPVLRSRFKKKLYEQGTIAEYNKKMILSPFISVPKNNKNINNFQFLVQRSWIYMFVDKDKRYVEGYDLEDFINEVYNN